MQKTKGIKRASVRKYHYIYKTTCIITNMFYIGMHSTDNLEDGYAGSGTRLWHSINKHGKENHVTKIVEFLIDRNSLKTREKELVNEDMLNDKMCMNIQLGGGGGFISEEIQRNRSIAGGNAFKEKFTNDEEFKQRWRNAVFDSGAWSGETWLGRKHNEETKKKIGASNSIKQSGSLNSQFGKCWIYNIELKQNISIKMSLLEPYLIEGWIKGRKMKF
jgi:hypothetical protein